MADLIPGIQPEGKAAPSAWSAGNIVTKAINRPLEVLEVPLAIGAAALGGIPTYLAGAFGPKVQQTVAKEVMYQPRGQLAQEALEAVGRGFEASKLPPYMPAVAGQNMLQESLKPAMRAVTDVGQAAAATGAEALAQPIIRRAVNTAQQNLAKSYQNASQIDAAQAAQRLGAVVNPAISNPTTSNVVKGALSGTAGKDAWFSKKNESVWVDKAKEVIGAEKNTVLNDTAIETALDKASKPYEPIKNIIMQPTDDAVASLEATRISPTIGGDEAAAAINALVDDAQQKLGAGRSGADVLRDIRQLRRDANSTFQSQKAGMAPDPAKVAKAEASIKIANTLESLIDANAPDAQTLQNIKQARTKLAQIFDVDRATNKVTGRVDPMEFARMLAEGKQLTGTLRDMGMFAGNFPSNATISAGAAPTLPNLSRSGPAGTMGYATGAVAGVSPVATSVGGAGVGSALSGLVARRMATPEYQARFAVPRDYRPNMPEVMAPYEPNFVMQGRPYTPQPGPAPITAPNRLLGVSSNEDVMNNLAARREFERRMAYAVERQADVDQAAAEAAARRPTRGEVILDINPLTGAPEISKGLKGATPETFQNFGSSLASAADKVTAGKAFDMTAAERVAWNKTKVDLAEIMPGMKALDEKAVAAKMMDRDWAAQAIEKARQQAAAFEQIAARAKDAQARAKAIADRERMMDLAEQMEEGLRTARPVSTGGQGPKTRAFQRNRLNPDQEVLNQLLGK